MKKTTKFEKIKKMYEEQIALIEQNDKWSARKKAQKLNRLNYKFNKIQNRGPIEKVLFAILGCLGIALKYSFKAICWSVCKLVKVAYQTTKFILRLIVRLINKMTEGFLEISFPKLRGKAFRYVSIVLTMMICLSITSIGVVKAAPTVRGITYELIAPLVPYINALEKEVNIEGTDVAIEENSIVATEIEVTATPSSTAPAKTYTHGKFTFSESDILLLQEVVYAEAASESVEGKTAVAAVILNRMKSNKFSYATTMENTIWAKNQFSCMFDGNWKRIHDGEVISQDTKTVNDVREAVKKALDGEDPSKGALYYYRPEHSSISGGSWIANNTTYVTKIGNHVFSK